MNPLSLQPDGELQLSPSAATHNLPPPLPNVPDDSLPPSLPSVPDDSLPPPLPSVPDDSLPPPLPSDLDDSPDSDAETEGDSSESAGSEDYYRRSMVFDTQELADGENNAAAPGSATEDTKQAKMFPCNLIPPIAPLAPADAVYGNVKMDVDSIVLVSLTLFQLLEALQVEGSTALLHSLTNHTRVNLQSKLYVKSTPPAGQGFLSLRPTLRGRARRANCPLHWFRNNQFMQVMSGGPVLTFYVSLFVMDTDYIRGSPAYLTNHHMAALNAAFNAAKYDYAVFPKFQTYSNAQKREYKLAMKDIPKSVCNHGPMKDKHGSKRPTLVNVDSKVPHHVYPDFAEIAHYAMKDMARNPPDTWLVPYTHRDYHGFDVGTEPFQISAPELQLVARDIYDNGLYVAQAVGTKQGWKVNTTHVVNMSVPEEINKFAADALHPHVKEIYRTVLNRTPIAVGKVVMYADIALTVHPTQQGISFLLKGQQASQICVKACELTTAELSLAAADALAHPDPGLHVIGQQQLSTWDENNVLNADVVLPGFPSNILFSNGDDPSAAAPANDASDSSDSTPPGDDLASAEAAGHIHPEIDDAVFGEHLQLEEIQLEEQTRSAKMFSQYGTHNTIANVQHDRPSINYYSERHPDGLFTRTLERGLPPDRVIAAAQIYMPETRLYSEKKSYKSINSGLLSLPKNIQKFFQMCNSGVSNSDDHTQLYCRTVTQVNTLDSIFNTTVVNGKSTDCGRIRFEYTFMDLDDESQTSSAHASQNPSDVVQWFWPLDDAIVLSDAILIAKQSSMRSYLDQFIVEHLMPLISVFRDEYSSNNAIPDLTSVTDAVKTGFVYHAEQLLTYNEVAPNYHGSIFRFARDSCKPASNGWQMRRLPIKYLTTIDIATHPHHVDANYGIQPSLLPLLRKFDYDELPKPHRRPAQSLVKSETNIRNPSLYNVGACRMRHVLVHFSVTQKRAGIKDGSYGTFATPDYGKLAALTEKEYNRLLRSLCNEFFLLYDEHNRVLVNTHLHREHVSTRRMAAFTTARAQHGRPTVLTRIPMTEADCSISPFNQHFRPSRSNAEVSYSERNPIHTVADFVHTLFGGSPAVAEYQQKSGWDKCPIRRLYLRVYEHLQKTRDCLTRAQVANFPSRFTTEDFNSVLFDEWIKRRSTSRAKPILLTTTRLQPQHKYIMFYRTIERRDNSPTSVPAAHLTPPSEYSTHQLDAAMQATVPSPDILQSHIFWTPTLSIFRFMMLRPFFHTVCSFLSEGTQLDAIKYNNDFARRFSQIHLSDHHRVGYLFDTDEKITCFIKNLSKDLQIKHLKKFNMEYINRVFLEETERNVVTAPNKRLWRAIIHHLPLDDMQKLVDYASNRQSETMDSSDVLAVTIPPFSGLTHQHSMLDQIMTRSQDKTSRYFADAFVQIECSHVISPMFLEIVTQLKTREVSLRTDLHHAQSDEPAATRPARIEACQKVLDDFYARHRSSGKASHTNYSRKRRRKQPSS